MKLASIFALSTFIALAGCSTPQPVEPRQAAADAPPATQVQKLPLELAPPAQEGLPEVFKGKPCQLGKSCLAMDPRPFEVCLLGTHKLCGDKMAETLQVVEQE